MLYHVLPSTTSSNLLQIIIHLTGFHGVCGHKVIRVNLGISGVGVAIAMGLLLPCGLSHDHIDIACIMASAMQGMSTLVKLRMGLVE